MSCVQCVALTWHACCMCMQVSRCPTAMVFAADVAITASKNGAKAPSPHLACPKMRCDTTCMHSQSHCSVRWTHSHQIQESKHLHTCIFKEHVWIWNMCEHWGHKRMLGEAHLDMFYESCKSRAPCTPHLWQDAHWVFSFRNTCTQRKHLKLNKVCKQFLEVYCTPCQHETTVSVVVQSLVCIVSRFGAQNSMLLELHLHFSGWSPQLAFDKLCSWERFFFKFLMTCG